MGEPMAIRSCVSCRNEAEKATLLRVVRRGVEESGVERGLTFDIGQRLPGRGAYLCRRRECLRREDVTSKLLVSLELGSRVTKAEARKVKARESISELLSGLSEKDRAVIEQILGPEQTESHKKTEFRKIGFLR